jgi:hypothetical protein
MPLVDIVLVVLGIGFLIFIHELGHFLFAKKVGIRVERFAIGFGPKIIGFVRGGTDYAVRLFPLGGYVAMAGEDPTAESTGASDEFAKKTVWERVQVVSAGVLFNAISAFFLFAIAFGIGVPMAPATVGGVEIGGPAWVAGLEEGDEVMLAPPLSDAAVTVTEEAGFARPGRSESAGSDDGSQQRSRTREPSAEDGSSSSTSESANSTEVQGDAPSTSSEGETSGAQQQGRGRPDTSNMSPEQIEQMRERFRNMSPEEREQARQRMRPQQSGE